MEQEVRRELDDLRGAIAGIAKRLEEVEARMPAAVPDVAEEPRRSLSEERRHEAESSTPGERTLLEADKAASDQTTGGSPSEASAKSGYPAQDIKADTEAKAVGGRALPAAHSFPSSDRMSPAKERGDLEPLPAPTSPSGAGESLETRIGLYWLNRLGIASLVIGIALLLIYSFQYFGPAAKIATGLGASALLLGLGEWLERKKGLSAYARGLMGGGWSVAYFTTYAMHHVPAVRILESAALDMTLLLGVAAGAMWHSVERKSEIMAVLALVLGFATISLTGVGYFSALSTGLLVAAVSLLSIKMRWYKLMFWGVAGSYLTFFAGTSRGIAELSIDPEQKVWLKAAYLGTYWILYNAVMLSLKEDTASHRTRLIVASLGNAVAFVIGMGAALNHVLAGREYLFPLCAGSLYLISCPFAHERGLKGIWNVHWLVGTTLVTAGMTGLVASDWVLAAWCMEVAALTWIGLRFEIPVLRWFALALAALTSLGLVPALLSVTGGFGGSESSPHALLINTIGVISFATAAACHRAKRFQDCQGASERSSFFYLYFTASAFIAILLPAAFLYRKVSGVPVVDRHLADSLLPVIWALESAGTAALSMVLRDRFVRFTGIGWLLVCGLISITTSGALWWSSATVIALIYTVAFVAQRVSRQSGSTEHRGYFYTCFAAAMLLTWAYTAIFWSDGMLALRLAGEALAAASVGFLLRERFIRVLAGLGFVGAGWTALLSVDSWSWIGTGAIVAMLYTMDFLYRQAVSLGEIGEEHNLSHWYQVAGTLLLTALIGANTAAGWLSPAWALEAVALLSAGFLVPDKFMRVSGLAVFGLVLCKLLFVDLSGAETMQRIFSFIGAGILLLIASYAYAAFARRFAADPQQASPGSAIASEETAQEG